MSNDKFTISVQGKMLPALMHMLMIGRNTAMMCGSPAVKAEAQRLYEELATQAGIPNLLRAVDEYKWHAACEALARAKAFHWRTTTSWSNKAGDVSLIIDDREYRLEHDLPADTPNLGAIQSFLERYAHVEAVKGEPVTSWQRHEPAEAVASPPAEDEESAAPSP